MSYKQVQAVSYFVRKPYNLSTSSVSDDITNQRLTLLEQRLAAIELTTLKDRVAALEDSLTHNTKATNLHKCNHKSNTVLMCTRNR